MIIQYYWSRLVRKISGRAIRNCTFEKPSKVEAQSTVINSSFGRYSYCGYGCQILNSRIGRFCSISDNVSIGASNHPINWVSTSPAFYFGRDSIPKNLAKLKFEPKTVTTVIGNDVWIGRGAFIKEGVTIGDGAIIGMGSVVTKNVKPFEIVAGNPAKNIRYRFDNDTIEELLKIRWWDYEFDQLKKIADHMNDIDEFITTNRK